MIAFGARVKCACVARVRCYCRPGGAAAGTDVGDEREFAGAAVSGCAATVLISNHSEFDDAVDRNRMLAGRGNGPHPYEVGAESVQNFFKVTQGCGRAAQIALEKQAVTGSR